MNDKKGNERDRIGFNNAMYQGNQMVLGDKEPPEVARACMLKIPIIAHLFAHAMIRDVANTPYRQEK